MAAHENAEVDPRYQRVPEDDPRRCQAVLQHGKGQCRLIRKEYSDYCVMHAGHFDEKRERTYEKRIYNLNKYRQRVGELADNPSARYLGEELGILRLMVEEIMNACKGDFDLILYSKQLGDLIVKIQSMVLAIAQLETKAGLTLNKAQALALGSKIIEAINRVVTDPEQLEQIADAISGIFLKNEAINPDVAFREDQLTAGLPHHIDSEESNGSRCTTSN